MQFVSLLFLDCMNLALNCGAKVCATWRGECQAAREALANRNFAILSRLILNNGIKINHWNMSLTSPRKIFMTVTAVVFVVVFGLSLLITFMLPKTYASTARVNLKGLAGRPDAATVLQAQAELAQSEAVLDQVVARQNLNEVFGRKFRVEGAFKTWESVTQLKRQLEVSPIPSMNALEIQVYNDEGVAAAKIANGIAEAFCALSASSAGGIQAELVERAQPGAGPVRPNIPLNLTLGAVGGLILAVAVGGVAGWIFQLLGRSPAKVAEHGN